eukprot:CAMPEP_0184334720 /NCGR_PEP_ID=MMETSP1089-20130417/3407_1 /TAXON_ID=38269 ORGANISM="Gloeochaete wittrockiana, Strain SAG46.84" /NCGR_SAMPLE_ID=MMETSP1089 /ASSEMBLY_ACC=CAM_ASM_000445 /LENGTH=169 /DNA_ID=CAMNT_0026659053 /DNA_START=163 /DNA_END=669 /DNA_ORIENTATION=-
MSTTHQTQMTRNAPKGQQQQEKTWKFLNNTASDFSIEGKLIKKKSANANRVRFIFEDNFWHYACGNAATPSAAPSASSPSSLSSSSSSSSSYSPPSSPSQSTFVDETLTAAVPKLSHSEFVFTLTPVPNPQPASSGLDTRRPLLPPLSLLPAVSTSLSLPPLCAGVPVW